ncbi:MAG: YicC family protein [Thiobacillaceae bacterium]|nr:YicC family protein [Thiobacillaceae bacterium]
MTGYAVETAELPEGHLSLELRSVNARFLELAFRIPEDLRPLESQLRERIARDIRRGKLECRINYQVHAVAALPEAPDAALLDRLVQLAAQVQSRLPQAAPLTVADVLRWPGMLGEVHSEPAALYATVMELLERALRELTASRAREGERLRSLLQERVEALRQRVYALRPQLPAIVTAYREKLTRRMEELAGTPERDRILQEVALYAQKIDVEEELGRLESHLAEVERVLGAGGAVGKRLDFLMQELHREANPLGSKSVTAELAQTSVELKVLIEQMREQVQNLE